MVLPISKDEEARLRALRRYEILDTPGEQEYDDIAMLAAQICGTPIASISLIDKDRQWFKAKIGLNADETPRDIAFCAYAILSETARPFVINDATKDKRFSANPLVTNDPNVRFYAGAPLITPDNYMIGTICVIDNVPRELTEAQLNALEALARQTTAKLELRRMAALLKAANEELRNLTLTDDLTDLFNRRGFLFHAEQQLKLFRSRKSDDGGLWLMMADLDGLKKINDEHGHQEGSFAIKKAAEIMRQNFRSSDIIARLGGDEFVVLLIHAFDGIAVKATIRLEKKFREYNESGEKKYPVDASVGLIKIKFADDSTIEEIMRQADELMYQQKKSRKLTR